MCGLGLWALKGGRVCGYGAKNHVLIYILWCGGMRGSGVGMLKFRGMWGLGQGTEVRFVDPSPTDQM